MGCRLHHRNEQNYLRRRLCHHLGQLRGRIGFGYGGLVVAAFAGAILVRPVRISIDYGERVALVQMGSFQITHKA